MAGFRTLVGKTPFDAIAIEDILDVAQVSRATFYRHFKAKRDVALALYETVMEGAIPHFDALTSLASDDHDGAIDWVNGLVAIYRRNGPASALILQLGVLDPVVHARLRADRQWLIRRLAPESPTDAALREVRVRADLWLMALDRICVEIAVHRQLADASLYVAEIARELLELRGNQSN